MRVPADVVIMIVKVCRSVHLLLAYFVNFIFVANLELQAVIKAVVVCCLF